MPDSVDDEIARRLAGVRAQEDGLFIKASRSALRVTQALPAGWRREIGPKKARRAWERVGADGLPGLIFTPRDQCPIAIVQTDFAAKRPLRPGEKLWEVPNAELEYRTGLAVRPGSVVSKH